ncbi:MAG: putative oxidoreductase [Pyrinomonadaceae bacterium]|jgi:putative oxidoreductase|nr:putative oxidoreductase [Pyrinomonadaceae bacterium]
MFRRLISSSATWVPLPLRLTMSTIFVAHGAQKVFGSFNGPGFQKWTSIPLPFSFMKPTWLWLAVAAFSELIGGVLIFLGLLTRVGAFLIACTMVTAIAAVHWPSFFVPQGIEYPLALSAICLALLISGGGMASVDLAMSGGRRR